LVDDVVIVQSGVTPEQLKGRQQAGVGDSRPAFDIFSLPPAPVTALPVAAAGSARSRAGSFSAAANIADDGDDEAWTRETFIFGFGKDPSSATTATFGSSPTFSLHLGTTSTSTSASGGTTAPAPAPTFPSSAPLTVPPSLSSSSSSAPGGTLPTTARPPARPVGVDWGLVWYRRRRSGRGQAIVHAALV
jgi:hypothetical protein